VTVLDCGQTGQTTPIKYFSGAGLIHESTDKNILGPDGGDSASASDGRRLSDAEKKAARRVQVRRAQILHRQRKAEYTKQLEADVDRLQGAIADTDRDAASLRDENDAMRATLGRHMTNPMAAAASSSSSYPDIGQWAATTTPGWTPTTTATGGYGGIGGGSGSSSMPPYGASSAIPVSGPPYGSSAHEQELFADVDINALVRRIELEKAMGRSSSSSSSAYPSYGDGSSGSSAYPRYPPPGSGGRE
jgi:hypothetical protein